MHRHNNFTAGIAAALPVMLGFIPVGIAYAVMAAQAGFTPAETILMSVGVYAGASQMMAVGMFAGDAAMSAIVLATFILNLRHFIMSTCVARRMAPSPLPLRLLTAFGVTDETFAVFSTCPENRANIGFFGGLALGTYLSWIAGSAIGAFASGFLPAVVSASLAITLYALFIGLLVPGIRGNLRLGLLAAGTAALNALLSSFIPSGWAIICSTLAGAFAGVFFVDLDGGRGGAKNED